MDQVQENRPQENRPQENRPQENRPQENITNTEPPAIPISKTEKIKILSQGAYGCVFRPGPSCTANEPTGQDYIVKIQKKDFASNNEIQISKKIMDAYKKTYTQYFSPILETCPVQLSMIQNDEIQKCDLFKNKPPATIASTFESNRIKYVGEYTLEKYFNKLTRSANASNRFLQKLIDSHMILLEGVQRLDKIQVVHLDIKENNVVFTKAGRPILIDFGLSIDMSPETKSNDWWEDSFFEYAPNYGPWCIDICMINYIVNEVRDWQKKPATINELRNMIREFIDENKGIQDMLQPNERDLLRNQYIKYFAKFDQLPWTTVLDELLKYRSTWDNYGLALMYLYVWKTLGIYSSTPKLQTYKQLLMDILKSNPDTRPAPPATMSSIKKMFQKELRSEHAKRVAEFNTIFENRESGQIRDQNIAKSQIADLQQSKAIYESKSV